MIDKQFPYGVTSPASIPETADRVLDEYFEITARLGIRAAIILGVCCALYRDGEYFPGDNDIDVVAIVGDDLDRKYLIKKLIAAGFLMGRTYRTNNTHFVKDGILLDVFWRTGREPFYREFGSVPYKTTAYPIPSPIDEYLTACYGDWRISNPDHPGSVYEG